MKKVVKVLSLVLALVCLSLLAGCSSVDDLSGTMVNADFIVKIGDRTIGYSTFSEAWQTANENTADDVTITCNVDVKAENGKFGNYGELTVNERTGYLTVDLTGHTIDRGLTSPDDSGAVFAFFNKTGTITIKNGTITGGNKTQHGGGIYVDSDNLELTLQNITLTGNTAGINGGGMYIAGCTGRVILTNVVVTGNTAAFGGGIHWDAWNYEDDSKMADVIFNDKIIIRDNTVTGDAVYSNLVINQYPHGASYLSVYGLTEDSEIRLACEDENSLMITRYIGDDAETFQKYFISEREGLHIAVTDNDEIWLTVDEESGIYAAGVYREDWGYWEYFTTCASAWTETDSHKEKVTMVLYKDWVADENGNLGTGNGYHNGAIYVYSRDQEDEITLDLNGHTINRGLTKETAKEDGCLFYQDTSAHIAVKNGTLTGGANTEEGGAIYYKASSGVFWLDNVTLTGNYSASDGGAIYFVSKSNYLCIRNSTITGNSNEGHGALYVTSSDHVTENYKVYLNLYGYVTIKDNSRGGLHMYKANLMYTEFPGDLPAGCIQISFESTLQPFCIVGGDKNCTRNAFRVITNSKSVANYNRAGFYCSGHDDGIALYWKTLNQSYYDRTGKYNITEFIYDENY